MGRAVGWVDPDGCRKAKDALKAGKLGRPEQVFTRSLEEGGPQSRLGWGRSGVDRNTVEAGGGNRE